MYRNLVQQFPGYIDCYLRLSAMANASEHILPLCHLFLPSDADHASVVCAAVLSMQAT
jgi:hypothetical protein